MILAAVAAGIALVMRNSSAASGDEAPQGYASDVDPSADLDWLSVVNDPSEYMDPSSSSVEQRREAALYMIRSCEHTAASVSSGDDYQTFYGGSLFWDLSDHPTNTGEMPGVPLSAQMCINAGFSDGVCVSTAAGAYQITRPTWNEIRDYGGTHLPDFTPESQDVAALRLLSKIGALPLIDAGNIQAALPKIGTRWASIPGAIGKQGQRSMDFALSKFNEGLTA